LSAPPSRLDSIAAQATPRGAGERGILRLSGPDLLARAAALLPPGCPRPSLPPRREVRSGNLEWARGAQVPVELWVFPGPRSATGEDVLELHLPGAQPVLDLVLEQLLTAGARAADPGEFTRRAFLNGRLDLVQAEAVLDLVQARAAEAATAAAHALSGALGGEARAAQEALAAARVELEAGLDFAEGDSQDVAPADVERLLECAAAALARGSEGELQHAARSRAEFRILLCGAPNAGKSSLLRALTGAEVLTSPESGTTRDRIEARWHAAAATLPWILIDGPGTGGDPVDPRDAAARARAAGDVTDADLAWLCRDASDAAAQSPAAPAGLPALRLRTKSDLSRAAGSVADGALLVSAHTGDGFTELAAATARTASAAEFAHAARLASGARHAQALAEAATALNRARALQASGGPQDLVAEEVREAARALGELTGELTPEDLLDRLFARFCVGK
jgi:tRNA modification GTPase